MQEDDERMPEGWNPFFDQVDPIIMGVLSWPKWHLSSAVQEDVAQKIRTELVRLNMKSQSPETIPMKVRRITISRCIDEIRKIVRFEEVKEEYQQAVRTLDSTPGSASEGFDPFKEVLKAEQTRLIRELVSLLDETCVTVIQGHYMEGYTYREIAEQQGVSINTIGGRLARCLQKLKHLVEKRPMLREELARFVRIK